MRIPQTPWLRLAGVGRVFAGTALLALGVQQIVLGRLVTRIVLAEAPWGPLPPSLAYVVGLTLIGLGAGIALGRAVAFCGRIFALLCFVSFLALHVRFVLADIPWGGTWTSAGKVLSFCALGLVLASGRQVPLKNRGAAARSGSALLMIARVFFAAFLVLGGIQHFVWAKFVQTLVPAWIPGAMFWTYFAGVALILGGVGLLLERTLRLTGLLVGAMIFVWFLVLHVPRALTMRNANETTAVFEALAFAGLAWLLAGIASERDASTSELRS
jgi:uncharacterized membrane protein